MSSPQVISATSNPEILSSLSKAASHALEIDTNHLKKVVRKEKGKSALTTCCSVKPDHLGQKTVNLASNVHVVQVGCKNAAPFYLRLIKLIFS